MSVILSIYVFLIIAYHLYIGFIGLRFKRPLPHDGKLSETPPLVSVIVPARNEERNIQRCLTGLSSQTYPNLEIIIVDDQSNDLTPVLLAEIAKTDQRIRVIRVEEPIRGWNGKQWACHTGVMSTKGEWLCFMDADTFAEPDLIMRSIIFATDNHIDMLTLQPWYEMRGLWERLVMPAILIPLLAVYPPHRINNPDAPMAIANGQFIFINRRTYDAIGGHEAVRGRMMDDFPLAENVKRAGYRLWMADGADLFRVRMYRNFSDLYAGMLKTAIDITGGWHKTILLVGIHAFFEIIPGLLFFSMLLGGYTVGVSLLGIAILFQLSYYALVRMIGFRLPAWSAVGYLIGSVTISVVLIDGMLRALQNRSIEWKGRRLIGVPTLAQDKESAE